ncbi:uncharacterized protein ACNS7B_021095 isoform 1-T1 [Menidia menidia]
MVALMINKHGLPGVSSAPACVWQWRGVRWWRATLVFKTIGDELLNGRSGKGVLCPLRYSTAVQCWSCSSSITGDPSVDPLSLPVGGAVIGMPGLSPRQRLLGLVRGRGPGFCFHHHQRLHVPNQGMQSGGPGRESPPPGLDMTVMEEEKRAGSVAPTWAFCEVMKAVQVERTSPPNGLGEGAAVPEE